LEKGRTKRKRMRKTQRPGSVLAHGARGKVKIRIAKCGTCSGRGGGDGRVAVGVR